MQILDQTFAEAMSFARAGRAIEAVQLLSQLAEAGHPGALFTLGDCYWRGAGVVQDLARGRELFKAASDAGHPMAVRAWTNLLSSGIAGERRWPEALARLEKEAIVDGLRSRMFDVIGAMNLDQNGDPAGLPPAERASDQPDVSLFRGAFTAEECDFLILLAEPTYQRSVVNLDGKSIPDPVRTSDGSTIHWLIEDPATHAINRRLAALSGTSIEQGEPLQILRYQPGQQYRPHVDWLGGENRRIVTALIYLNDDYEGGETEFVKTSLKMRGHQGDALVFRSVGPDNQFDPLSEHAGLPVRNGTKYVASRWIREARHTP